MRLLKTSECPLKLEAVWFWLIVDMDKIGAGEMELIWIFSLCMLTFDVLTATADTKCPVDEETDC